MNCMGDAQLKIMHSKKLLARDKVLAMHRFQGHQKLGVLCAQQPRYTNPRVHARISCHLVHIVIFYILYIS